MQAKIGELAKLAGCKTVTIRFYEKAGLLKAPDRTSSNYRIYGDEDLERLHFIRHCRLHGISLDEIRALLDFGDHPGTNCGWISDLIEKRIVDVENQIKDLEHLKEHLKSLRHKCSGGNGKCGIFESLKNCEECAHCKGKWPTV